MKIHKELYSSPHHDLRGRIPEIVGQTKGSF